MEKGHPAAYRLSWNRIQVSWHKVSGLGPGPSCLKCACGYKFPISLWGTVSLNTPCYHKQSCQVKLLELRRETDVGKAD